MSEILISLIRDKNFRGAMLTLKETLLMKCQTTLPSSAALSGRPNLCSHLPHHPRRISQVLPNQPIQDYPKTAGSVLANLRYSHLAHSLTGHDGEGRRRRRPARLLLGRRGRDPGGGGGGVVAGVDRVGGGVHLLAGLVVDDVLPGRRRGIGLGTVSGGGLGHGQERNDFHQLWAGWTLD